MPEIVEYRALNRPDLVIRLDARDAHLLDLCRWHVRVKPRSATFYVQGFLNGKGVYLHRMITDPPQGLEVNHKDGNGLNNTRANLALVTHAENCRHAADVLKRGGMVKGPRVALLKNKVRRKLSDGTYRVHVYDRRTGQRIETYDELPRVSQQTGLQTVLGE